MERLTVMVGPSVFREIERTFVARPTTFRVNTLKWKLGASEMKKLLVDHGFQVRQVSWYHDAFILLNKSKRELTELDIYKEGKIYIQSLASMVPSLVLDPQPGEKVLDLTAAPGSKTSQLAAIMNHRGELVANDSNKVRFFKLKHNMEMLGVRGARAGWDFFLRMEPGVKLGCQYQEYFDKILLDAPCSAEARFIVGERRTYAYWSLPRIKRLAYQQQTLLLAAWAMLKPGGVLVYSTCTWAPEENESRISKLLDRQKDAAVLTIDLPGLKRLPSVKEWQGRVFQPDVAKCLRLFPTREMEGFFIATLRKKKGERVASDYHNRD